MRTIVSITLAAVAAVQLAGCNDSALLTRPRDVGPSKLVLCTISGCNPTPNPVIQPVPDPNDLIAITAGAGNTCVQRRNGNVYCWGQNDVGQTPGTTFAGTCPAGSCVKAPSFAGVATQVSAGLTHTCLLSTSGAATCYGRNWEGELGLGFQSPTVSLPAPVPGITFSTIVARNGSTCGVSPTGVYCWGSIVNNYPSPVLMPGIPAVYKSLGLGDGGLCGQTSNRTDCFTNWSTVPVSAISSLTTAGVSMADNYLCLNDASGVVKCVGSGNRGELGNGQYGTFSQLQLVGGGQPLSRVTTGLAHACALDPNGYAYCWGLGLWGEVGNGVSGQWNTPQAVVGGHTFRALAAGEQHTCGISTDNHIWCWGNNTWGQIGVNYYNGGWWPTPQQATDPAT